MFKDNKYLIPVMLIFGVIIWIIGGTLAYWNWQSSTAQKTEVTFTVGSNFSCGANGGGNITNSTYFAPTTCTNGTYALKRTITTSITNNGSESVYMDLWLNINSIGTGLSNSDNFMYALTTDENSCSNNVVATGNFKGKNNTTDNKVELLSGVTTASTYYLWIWLDAAETSQSTMNQSVNLSLGGSCTNNTENMTLYNKVASQADLTKTIDFSQESSDTNGKGVYRFPGTENNTYPVYYYRGDIDNNHVKFANFCWKIVRTTDTGGVKLIYDGVPKNIYDQVPLSQNQYTISTNDANFTWDATDSTWNATITDGQSHEISFTVPAGEGYNFIMSGTTGSTTGGGVTIFKDGNSVNGTSGGGGAALSLNYEYGTLTASNVIKMTYSGSSTTESPITFKIKMLHNGELLAEGACDNTGTDTHISTIDIKFNENYNSPAYVGYMYGDVYTYSSATGTNWYYGPDVTYENGTYTLTSKGSYNVEKKSTISGTNLNYQHYTCGSTTATTCTSVRYVYYVSSSTAYYITLTNGKKVEDALSDMFSNTTNSTIKTAIDTWYQNNMTSYMNKLEDTVYCNDGSIGTLNGWNPDGGNVTADLYFSGYNRAKMTYQPSLECTNKNDAFTVRESGIGNGNLTYPVGLITSDEAMLAGMKASTSNTGGVNYLNNNTYFWLGSPDCFGQSIASQFFVYSGGLHFFYANMAWGVRPAVSLKPGMKISGGDGSSTTPYEIN